MSTPQNPFAMLNKPAAQPAVEPPVEEPAAPADVIETAIAADKAQNEALAEALKQLRELKQELAAVKAAQPAPPPPPPLPEMQKPDYAPVEQTPPVQYVEGERGWLVSLPRNPEAFVAVREGAHDRMAAIEVYKARMGIRNSIHPFSVAPATYQKPAKEVK